MIKCTKCGAIFGKMVDTCFYCGATGSLEEVDNDVVVEEPKEEVKEEQKKKTKTKAKTETETKEEEVPKKKRGRKKKTEE